MKYLHFVFSISFFILITTAIAAYFLFSKENIMMAMDGAIAIINSTNPFTNLQIESKDMFFIARILRRETWEYHFISGVIFSLTFFVFFIYRDKNKKLNIFFMLTFLSFTSGLLLQFRYYDYLTPDQFYWLKMFHKIVNIGIIVWVLDHLINNYKAIKGCSK